MHILFYTLMINFPGSLQDDREWLALLWKDK